MIKRQPPIFAALAALLLMFAAVFVSTVSAAPPDQDGEVLGASCSRAYEMDGDLVCSLDCGMTWRSLSNPGVCYNQGSGNVGSGGGEQSPPPPPPAANTKRQIDVGKLNQKLEEYGIPAGKVSARLVEGMADGAYAYASPIGWTGDYELEIGTASPVSLGAGSDSSVFSTLKTYEQRWAWIVCCEIRHIYQWKKLGAPKSEAAYARVWQKWEKEANTHCNTHWPEYMGIHIPARSTPTVASQPTVQSQPAVQNGGGGSTATDCDRECLEHGCTGGGIQMSGGGCICRQPCP